jgi:glycolate oxidase
MNRKTIKELKKVVGAGNLVTAREDLMCYSYDGTGMEYMPSAVVFPGSASEVCRIMEIAGRERFPVIPRGAGTGMTGGALAVEGGLVMAMSRLDRILEIDAENQVAVVEPGVITGRFQEAVRRQGLFYPPDPASQAFCTMGGNVAECSGGPSAVKYGVTRDYVLGLEVVLPSGKLIRTGVRTAKGVVGYDLTRLFIGSEGTLGIVTKIIVRLLALPTITRTFGRQRSSSPRSSRAASCRRPSSTWTKRPCRW